MKLPHEEFHEIWWIYSPVNGKPWAGLRIAHFRKTCNDVLVCVIQGETDPHRLGLRVWEDIQRTEHWYRVGQIRIPTMANILAAALTSEPT